MIAGKGNLMDYGHYLQTEAAGVKSQVFPSNYNYRLNIHNPKTQTRKCSRRHLCPHVTVGTVTWYSEVWRLEGHIPGGSLQVWFPTNFWSQFPTNANLKATVKVYGIIFLTPTSGTWTVLAAPGSALPSPAEHFWGREPRDAGSHSLAPSISQIKEKY